MKLRAIRTYHIHIEGIVQGVGFRPFVYQLARSKELNGWVNNTHDGVHIEINASKEQVNDFVNEIIEEGPALANILNSTVRETESKSFSGFEIVDSLSGQQANLPLTPDFALCEDCREDLSNSQDRRYGYAFTTCTNCGPRYSIIKQMPYDRDNTTMELFRQCPDCAAEYDNPLNRRHFSQTNSCPQCGITMHCNNSTVDVTFIVDQLREGKILAIKGIGGFLLVTDANNSESIAELRRRKHRPSKPFAVMYPNLTRVTEEYDLSDEAVKHFIDEVAPIILLAPKKDGPSISWPDIAPGLDKIGIMLPYAPLFQLILDQFKQPIVATSGNISGSPIIYTNDDAEKELNEIADLIITNDRDIVIPQDDSLISISGEEQLLILRRARGLAPTLLHHNLKISSQPALAMGADMKAAFALTHRDYLYVSQYLGDMDSFLTQRYYEKTLEHLQSVLEHRPKVILADKHPGYFSTKLGQRLADESNLQFHQIQHHKAHFYAVLAENSLLQTPEPVLGIIWDGTGYGDDGMIWGGEFFIYEEDLMSRVAHLPYFPFILGDKMPREPRIGALAVGQLLEEESPSIRAKFNDTEWQLYQSLLAAPTLQTSSMGRLFDAVASLVLGIDKTSYEGEAAMLLEAAARPATGWASAASYTSPKVNLATSYNHSLELFQSKIFRSILDDIKSGTANAEIALKFHYSLVNLIRQEAEKLGAKKLAFSGGVFQNSLLVDLILKELSTGFALYFHRQLSPNDENISFGQLAWYTMHETT